MHPNPGMRMVSRPKRRLTKFFITGRVSEKKTVRQESFSQSWCPLWQRRVGVSKTWELCQLKRCKYYYHFSHAWQFSLSRLENFLVTFRVSQFRLVDCLWTESWRLWLFRHLNYLPCSMNHYIPQRQYIVVESVQTWLINRWKLTYFFGFSGRVCLNIVNDEIVSSVCHREISPPLVWLLIQECMFQSFSAPHLKFSNWWCRILKSVW